MALVPLPPPNAEIADGRRQPTQAYALYFKALDVLARIALIATNNLSDVANAATALANLGGLAIPGAWTNYTPVISASSGTFTTVSATGRFVQLGKIVHFNISVTITTVGTASGGIIATMPTPIAAVFTACGRETAVTGKMLQAIQVSGNTISIAYYDNTSAIGAGNIPLISGTYEST